MDSTKASKNETEGRELRLGLPKGSLQEATFALFRKAGFDFSVPSRSYHVSSDDREIRGVLIRAQEIARYVGEGVLDAGLTGMDWILETKADVHIVMDLVYAKATRRKPRWSTRTSWLPSTK